MGNGDSNGTDGRSRMPAKGTATCNRPPFLPWIIRVRSRPIRISNSFWISRSRSRCRLGPRRMLIRELLQLGQGSVIELNKLAGEPMEVLVNNKLVARGEVVVVNEKFGIRLTDVVSPNQRIQQFGLNCGPQAAALPLISAARGNKQVVHGNVGKCRTYGIRAWDRAGA
jgi:flagellar motor switch protein FliN